jgi:hypothetical protein
MLRRKLLQRTLQLLIELQEIEKRIGMLTERKARTPERIAALEDDVHSVATHLDQQQELLESVRKSRRELEREVEGLEERAAGSKRRLLEVKSNKEYQALLREIDEIGELVREREDRILDHMERTESLQSSVQEQKRLLEEARRRMEREGAELKRQAEEADSLIGSLEEHAARLKAEIPAESLTKYEFLKARRGGIALAAVNRGTCQVCHMSLPPQMFIDLQRDEQLLQCPICQRIIYWVGHEAYQRSSRVLEEYA